ncbi:MAG: NAD(P)-dependent alcohol dehydrogenase, partial [Catalinimonas sp.]
MRTILYNRYGATDVLELDQMPIPEVGPDEVLVENYATSINPVDWKIRQGNLRVVTGLRFPKVPGGDVAGVVREVGSDVRRFQVGDRVFAMVSAVRGGTYAEYVALKASDAVPMPDNLNFAEAAAVPLAGITAYQGLVSKGKLSSNQEVLVNGASGGVGTLAVQMARVYGASVTGVCSTHHVELVRSLGAERVVDYTREDVLATPQRFDLVFDTIGNYSFTALRPLLKPGGRVVSLAVKPNNVLFAVASLFMKESFQVMFTQAGSSDLHQIKRLIEAGTVRPVIDRVFDLEDAAAAHHYSQDGHA